VILFHLNPIHPMGCRAFFEEARSCGVDGVVVPVLAIEEPLSLKETAQSL